ncbi:murein hydrolase activator EnvC family protein [Anaerosalibacter massiliensis]|uniref:Peptidoglycan DD-metalloendopeptidase family protein n=1 Tax=Anaerosalibacter massiliensis TaxID=1347392 RepID=A0A9X2MIR7_9FIRM|nr:M23 family metallopeptidase [Anaerosalibacter massiliensis]MCR2043917.1 peptidoglycan DD-metalloendopeptidase family protein [Anaerosalibacter massiliensis]
MGRSKKVITLLIALLVFNCVAVYAVGDVNSLKNEQKGVNRRKEEKKNEINKLEKKQKNISNEIKSLDKEVNEASDELSKVEKKLANLNNDIEKTTKEIEEAERKIGKRKDAFNSRLRAMYMNGNIGYIEVLLSAADIKDFLLKKEMVQAVVEHDTDLLDYMQEQRNIMDTKKKELKTQIVSAESTKRQVESKKNELMVATRGKQKLMNNVEKDKKELQNQLDELERESNQIASQIANHNNSNNSNNSKGKSGGSTGGSTASISASVTPTGGAMIWPTSGPVTSPFGPRWGRLHTGIDIGVGVGTPVVAAKDGVVILTKTGYSGGYGNYIVVDHGGGVSTLYAHNSSLSVGVGTRVRQGQQIAVSGNSGRSTGPHLHFEVRINGRPVNPMGYLR